MKFFPPPFVLVENCAAPSDNASGSWILMGPLRMMNKWEILIKGGTFVCCCRLSRAQHKSQFLCRGDGKQAHILGERGSTREKVLSRKSNGSKKSIHAVRMGGHRRLKLNCVRGRNESFFCAALFSRNSVSKMNDESFGKIIVKSHFIGCAIALARWLPPCNDIVPRPDRT